MFLTVAQASRLRFLVCMHFYSFHPYELYFISVKVHKVRTSQLWQTSLTELETELQQQELMEEVGSEFMVFT